MRKTTKKSKKTSKRPSGRKTKPVPSVANRERTQPAADKAGTEAPVTSTHEFKAGKDL